MYLNSINHFRAVAIFFIVFSHCIDLAEFKFSSFSGKIAYNLLVGGTTFFVFISGVLFHHVFYHRFDYKKFVLQKIKYVLTPYLIIAFPLYTYYVFFDDKSWEMYSPEGEGVIAQYLIPFLKYYLTGFRVLAFWYIPFAMILFTLSPVFIRFIQLSTIFQLTLIAVLLTISSLIHRPVYNSVFDVLQPFFYFLPVYLIGIMTSVHKKRLLEVLRGKELYLIALGITLATLSALMDQVGTLRKPPFEYAGFDLILIQKLTLCFFFFSWLSRFEKKQSNIINTISANSFGIFFIHPVLLIIFSKLKLIAGISFPPNQPLIFFSLGLSIFLLALLITLTVKKIFPNHSRLILGS